MVNETYNYDDMDDQEIRDKISELRKQGNLRAAYRLAVKAREDDVSVDWALSWVLYSYLKQEQKDADQQGNFNAFVKVLKQMDHFELFDLDSNNSSFWRSTQLLIISEAWSLAKAGRFSELYQLYQACGVLEPLFELDTDQLDPNDFYISKRRGDKDRRTPDEREGMWGFTHDLFAPLMAQLYQLDPLTKLAKLTPLMEKVAQSNASVSELIWERIVEIMTYDEYQLQHNGQKGELWKYWQGSKQFLAAVPNQLRRRIIAPYYYAFYDKDDLASSAQQLVPILTMYGFSNWPRDDFQHQPMKDGQGQFPSFVNQIMLANLKSLLNTDVSAADIQQIKEGIVALESNDDNSEYYNWIVYDFGKLLLKKKQFAELAALRPKIVAIIKQNPKVGYFWSLLAKCYYNSDQDTEIGLLEMALSLPNASQYDAAQLIQLLGSQADADKESQQIINGLVQEFPKLREEVPAAGDDVPEDLAGLLHDRAKDQVGSVLFSDCQKEFYVEWNNVEKNSTGIFFSKRDAAPTKIHDARFAAQVQEGHCYAAIIARGEYYGGLEERTDSGLLDLFRRDVQERLNIPRDSVYQYEENYGFLEPSGTYVSHEVIDKYKLDHYDLVSATIVSHWHHDKKKGKVGFENQLSQVSGVEHASDEERACTVEGQLRFSESRTGYSYVFLARDDGEADVFVPHALVGERFADGQEVSAKLIRSWDRKRERWSWKATDITATA